MNLLSEWDNFIHQKANQIWKFFVQLTSENFFILNWVFNPSFFTDSHEHLMLLIQTNDVVWYFFYPSRKLTNRTSTRSLHNFSSPLSNPVLNINATLLFYLKSINEKVFESGKKNTFSQLLHKTNQKWKPRIQIVILFL